jgi:hypothetical protein
MQNNGLIQIMVTGAAICLNQLLPANLSVFLEFPNMAERAFPRLGDKYKLIKPDITGVTSEIDNAIL